MLNFFGVVEVIDYGGYGSTSFQTVPADTKEEALILLGQKMLQFPSYCVLSVAVYNENHEKVYFHEQKDAHLSYQYARNHYNEHSRMKEGIRSRWTKLYAAHENVDNYLYGGKELTI